MWFRRWYAQRCCMHHNNDTCGSWVELIGALDGKKYFMCGNCGRLWILPRVRSDRRDASRHRSGSRG